VEGEITRYEWNWRFAEDYPVNEKFNHLYQLKAVNAQRKGTLPGGLSSGNENGMPILTFSAVDEKLSFIHSEAYGVSTPIASVSMDRVRGVWIHVVLEMLHADDGWVKALVTDLKTGEILMDVKVSCDLWRRPYQSGVGELDYPACYDQYNRPKWGIYRRVATSDQNPLGPAHLEIADLSIKKLKSI